MKKSRDSVMGARIGIDPTYQTLLEVPGIVRISANRFY
jgi:hypothetical protein